MAADRGAVDHVLPVVGEAQFDQRLQQRIPDTLFGPASEPDIDRVPLAVALMHVPPWATDPQHMQHTIEKRRLSPAGRAHRPRSDGSNGPTSPHSSSDKSPRPMTALSKSSLESETTPVGNPFCQHGLEARVIKATAKRHQNDIKAQLFRHIRPLTQL
jgi:hypothetical protein